jgi:hypothetical protein
MTNPYFCLKHIIEDDMLPFQKLRYKLDVEVYDGPETAKFIFWDNTLDELIGMTAATLLEKEKKVVIHNNNPEKTNLRSPFRKSHL